MKKMISFIALLLPVVLLAQQPPQSGTQQSQDKKKASKHWTGIGIGIKAGFNFANVTNASSINSSTRAGFQAGILFEPASSKILGSRTELIFSRHGFNYAAATVNGSVNLDYIQLTQMMAIHITSYVELQLGGYTSYLLHVRTDSAGQVSTGNAMADQIMSYYNRLDYGFGGGVEIHPVRGVLIGARYSLSFNNLYKQNATVTGTGTGQLPSPVPFGGGLNFKNNVVALFIGYRF